VELIVGQDLFKEYGSGAAAVKALRGVSFTIEKRAFLSFVGPSAGRLIVAGVDVTSLGRTEAAVFRGTHIGFIFQGFNLIPVLTAYENVEYPLVMVRNSSSSIRKTEVEDLLAAVGMIEWKGRRPDHLSGGQKQRVAIARALVTRPELVLADEPTANLDHDTAMSILRLMKKIRDEFGTTFVFSTHDDRIIGEAECIYRIEDGILKNRQDCEGSRNV
jgi:putative ABC transport system ATP-binding protein